MNSEYAPGSAGSTAISFLLKFKHQPEEFFVKILLIMGPSRKEHYLHVDKIMHKGNVFLSNVANASGRPLQLTVVKLITS